MNSDQARQRPAVHQPVMPREVIKFLDLAPGQTVVDGTVGAGGHSRLILDRILPGGQLIGIDRDPMMLELAQAQLKSPACHLVQDTYAHVDHILQQLQIEQVDRILVDLGLSSDQLADPARGFGIQTGGELDMRFDTRSGQTAAEFLAAASREELATVFEQYGEERAASRIADQIVAQRQRAPVRTAEQLAQLVAEIVPGPARGRHPATRVFQALRIVVNSELEQVRRAVTDVFPSVLADGGRLVVLTFHSLEDRIVKNALRESSKWQIITSKPITPTSSETKQNPRARSAKLRAARKVTS